MIRYAYIKFRDKVETALQGETNGLTWSQLKEKGAISQAHICCTWAKELESDIGLVRELRNHRVNWKLKNTINQDFLERRENLDEEGLVD